LSSRRRLFIDIETSPLQVFAWHLGDVRLEYQSIIKDSAIICICWKWAGKSTVESLTWNRYQDDKTMLRTFIPILSEADEIVAHNGDRFDIRVIRSRALVHEIPMAPNYPTLDTLKKARSKFRLPSNRLAYLSDRLVGERKLPTGFGLRRDIVLDRSETALKKMVDYCKQDVLLLERVFEKMANYIEPATSVAKYSSDCPECGSGRTIVNQKRKRASGTVHIQFSCKECGKFHTVPKSKFESDKPLAVA